LRIQPQETDFHSKTGLAQSKKYSASRENTMSTTQLSQVQTQAHTQARWQAVLQKDSTQDGKFFFAVKTTGIYCRPSCPSRTPLRPNVEFFATTEQAKQAGYRACKRCNPDGYSQREIQVQMILKACRLIEQSEQRMGLDQLAQKVGLSSYHFHRLFKQVTGVTPHDYHKARQVARVGSALREAGSVTDALYDAGFSSSSRFYEKTQSILGMKPTAFKKGGVGELIRYCIHTCALGLVLVAATERGICCIEFGDSADELSAKMHLLFPKAQLEPADKAFHGWLTKLLKHLDKKHKNSRDILDLPLDVRGTAFQQQVWRALQDIPLGQTRSYAQVAQKVGRPKAVRAVASACANNKLAVAIPCHRVLHTGADPAQQPGAYRWGVERKKALLRSEGAV
jgi:AraC family transcriptional regulator, regulatory protein of adaptative response / methylated-DNA-[protein]-cysteine methyltransferase